MLPEAIEYLRDAGFTKDGQVNRALLAARCAEVLQETLAATEDEIVAKALLPGEVRDKVLSAPIADDDVREEISQVFRQLLTPRSAGVVQQALADGHVLCSTKVPRMVGGDTRRYTGAFLTATPGLIETYYWLPQRERMASAASEYRARVDLGVKRQPQLAGRQAAALGEASAKVGEQLQLGSGTP